MNLKSLIPFGDGGTRAAPPANLFGTLHREIDRLFDDLTRGGLPAFGSPNSISCGDRCDGDRQRNPDHR